MGLTYVTVTVTPMAAGRSRKKPYQAQFLVDTGAVDSLASAAELRRIGVMVEGKDVYELANGDVTEYPFGHARLEFMGASTVTRVIFGPDDIEPILGVVALESTGIGVDPVTRSLRRMAAKPLKKRL